MIIKCENLVKRYKTKYHATEIFNGAGLEIAHGDFVGIMGRSGSGKTTLLNILVSWMFRTAAVIYLTAPLWIFEKPGI